MCSKRAVAVAQLSEWLLLSIPVVGGSNPLVDK